MQLIPNWFWSCSNVKKLPTCAPQKLYSKVVFAPPYTFKRLKKNCLKGCEIIYKNIPFFGTKMYCMSPTGTTPQLPNAAMEHSRLRPKSSQWHLGKKLLQTSRVDFCLPMGIESLWFRYRDLFPELIFRYRPICAAKNEVIRICHFLT